MGFRVAVVGATGNVGRELLTTLAEREFPADDVVALASSRSIGREVSFGEDDDGEWGAGTRNHLTHPSARTLRVVW